MSATFFLRIAEAELKVGAFEKALECCNESIGLDRNNGDAFWLRAKAHLKLTAFDNALTDVSIDLKLRPENPETHALHGDILGWQEQEDLAISAYCKGLNLDPNNQRALSGRGNCYYNLERWNDALSDFRHLVELGWKPADLLETIEELESRVSDMENHEGQG